MSTALIEYGDFGCPHCGRAYYEVKDVQRALGDEVRFEFRHFPLTQVHPMAQSAAEAAEAARAQGRFWDMHDLLFEHQDSLGPELLVSAADMLELDVERFVRDLREHHFAARVRDDFMSGVRAGVGGTPTFFVHGVKYRGPVDAEALIAALENGTPALR